MRDWSCFPLEKLNHVAVSELMFTQVELLQATATARACSMFRRDRAHADQQRSQAGDASGGANPGSRFAHIVEVDLS